MMAPQLPSDSPERPFRDAMLALATCAVVTAITLPLHGVVDVSNIGMFFLLGVALVAVKLGRAPAVVASIASVLLFDFFFVEPRFSFAVQDAQYLVTFGVMLVVALIISELTARLRHEAIAAGVRESRMQALYGLARDLSGATNVEQVAAITGAFVEKQLHTRSTLFVPDRDGKLAPLTDHDLEQADIAVATRVFETGQLQHFVSHRTGAMSLALPLTTPVRTRGALVVGSREQLIASRPSDQPLLDTVATLVAVVLERLYFVDVVRDARING